MHVFSIATYTYSHSNIFTKLTDYLTIPIKERQVPSQAHLLLSKILVLKEFTNDNAMPT